MAGIKYWLWLRTRHGLSNQICTRLLEQFGDPEKIYFAAPEDYLQTEGVTKAQLSALADKKLDRAEAVLEDCERLGVRILSRTDATYPSRLRAIPDAPCVLYYKGIWPDFDSEAAVALIGTRKATPYGIRIGERLGYELSKGGAYVVSGLAAGGDAAGHRGALLAGARTAAVLGGGIDVVYPAENRALFEDIAVNGVLISEYPPGTEPRGPHFLERNRIISGLSVGVIVVEAALRSGTMNTVRHAAEQGRDVYAVPGPVDAPFSQGCNRLLQEGAGVVTRAWDVLREWQSRFPDKIEMGVFDAPPSVGRTAPHRETEANVPAEPKHQETAVDNAEELAYIDLKSAREHFTDDQIEVLQTLSQKPMGVDDIAELSQIPVRRVLSALTVLEIEELVRQEGGGRYTLRAVLTE